MKPQDDELLARLFRAGKRRTARDEVAELPFDLVNRVANRWASGDINGNERAMGFLIWRMGLACVAANLIIITSLWLVMPSTSGGDSIALFLSLP